MLIVDDSSGVRAALRVALEVDGRFQVVGEAGDGNEAVAWARMLKPDVILLDLLMPGCDGHSALPQLREASPDSVVVILSSVHPSEVSPQDSLWAGAVLDKAADLASVVERIEQLRAVAGG